MTMGCPGLGFDCARTACANSKTAATASRLLPSHHSLLVEWSEATTGGRGTIRDYFAGMRSNLPEPSAKNRQSEALSQAVVWR